MFTGLIEAIGIIESVRESPAGREIEIRSPFSDLADGESIAVNGACLTVRARGDGVFGVAAVTTTLGRTTIGDWMEGQRVNLERALRADGRLGGHIVQGHVDAVGVVASVARTADASLVDIDLPDGLADSLVPLGSVAIDGVSLTVNAITGDRLQVSLIEYTLNHSALGDLQARSRVHIETDIIGKYVRRLTAPYMGS
ncbi:MAG TPA: riboflavin synthase [Gemmatimonadaceae bacterium]|jgi:riboflavin synthase